MCLGHTAAPPCFPQESRLRACFHKLIPRAERRKLVADCRAFCRPRHAEVSRRQVELYLCKAIHPLVVRRTR